MNQNQEVVDLAIERHDIDADHFQETYEGKVVTPHSKVFLYGRAMVLEELDKVFASLPKGSKVLDIGCGTGHLTKMIKDKGYDVCGIEPSDKMYNHAVKNFPDIDFKKGISSEVPYGDNEFDLIVAFEVLRYLNPDENKDSYKEFYRLLKPGGRFFVTHVNKYSSEFYYFFHYLKGMVRKVTGTTHHYCYFTTASEQNRILSDQGFKDINLTGRMSGYMRLLYKFGIPFGDRMVKMKGDPKKQHWTKGLGRNMAGHLIAVATK